ncbi:MAG: signal peptidase I [Desulfobulbaceae bacterium]|uniref:Signal peptidase I n=1 Tax=Candidatus Desulfobia pelagia TaxID=2841692 RepID=A0A8J6NBI6_9BACT|nr:signal peptidase I [Candidatus Desulfobia pelagia]
MAEENKKSVVREYAEAIVIALILALFIRTFVVQAFKIPSGSMIPTLLIGDHLLVNKFVYGIKNPFTGSTWISLGTPDKKDIIVFKYPDNPEQDFIKRVIGAGGDRVEIKNKKVFVNDQPLDIEGAVNLDPRIIQGRNPPRDNYGPITVPDGKLFVMGDNRDNSHDSRFWGFVDLQDVKGKAFIIYWSWNKEEFGVRWNRLGDLID